MKCLGSKAEPTHLARKHDRTYKGGALPRSLRLKLVICYGPMLDLINLLVWNIRGASHVDSLHYSCKLCTDNSVRLLVLLELMSELAQLEVVRRRLNFDHSFNFC